MSSAASNVVCPEEDQRQPGGKWSASDDSEQVKYAPKAKHGKPAGRREEVMKYKSLGALALERAFNGGSERPAHTRATGTDGCRTVNSKHFGIHTRAASYAHNKRFPFLVSDPKSTLRRRAAKKAVSDVRVDGGDRK